MGGSRLAVPDTDALPGGGFEGLEAYVSLMRRCWEADPGLRPGFEEVVQELHRVCSAHAKGSGDRAYARPDKGAWPGLEAVQPMAHGESESGSGGSNNN